VLDNVEALGFRHFGGNELVLKVVFSWGGLLFIQQKRGFAGSYSVAKITRSREGKVWKVKLASRNKEREGRKLAMKQIKKTNTKTSLFTVDVRWLLREEGEVKRRGKGLEKREES
jgi:hypothetical protein